MASITGGYGAPGGADPTSEGVARSAVAFVDGPAPGSSQERLALALLRCMGRWGLAKTTIEDIAREAGMSRATAYRLFPGGKTAMLDAALCAEVTRLVDEVSLDAAAATDLEECLTGILHTASSFLTNHDALMFVREHEPVVFEQYLGWERLDQLFVVAGELLAPVLDRFLGADRARATGIWLARLVVSHLQTPSPTLDLSAREGAHRLVREFVLPGLGPAPPGATTGPDG